MVSKKSGSELLQDWVDELYTREFVTKQLDRPTKRMLPIRIIRLLKQEKILSCNHHHHIRFLLCPNGEFYLGDEIIATAKRVQLIKDETNVAIMV
jgi:hypothetical protein